MDKYRHHILSTKPQNNRFMDKSLNLEPLEL